MLTTLLIDLDDTLYPSGNGLWNAIRDRMNQFMVERMGMPEGDVPALRRAYYERYGTTLRGLQLHHHVDPEAFLAYVHDLPLDQYLEPLPALRQILLSLPQRCWIFTNADAAHAARVIRVTGLEGCFAGIIDLHARDFACKPDPQAYRRALQVAGEQQPERCLMLDDSANNLAPAVQLGIKTALVGVAEVPSGSGIDFALPSLLDLPRLLPQLWAPASPPGVD